MGERTFEFLGAIGFIVVVLGGLVLGITVVGAVVRAHAAFDNIHAILRRLQSIEEKVDDLLDEQDEPGGPCAG